MYLDNHPSCSYCGGPFNGGNCPSCSSVGSENEFVYDPNLYSYNETPNFFNQPPQPQYETYSCELCGNDAHYGYDCPLQVLFVYNQDPCLNQDFDNFLQTSPNFQQQYLGCENCRGPHENFQCQPLNQNFYEPNHCYNSNSLGFEQSQPSQFPVIHQPPQETSVEILQARENLMKSIQTFLKNEKQHQLEDLQELLPKLLKDVQVIREELADYINTPNWNRPAFYKDDDEEYTIAITSVLPTEEPDNSLSMRDEQLSTIPETKSDELIKSSVENLVPIPSESEDFFDIESECDVPVCDTFTTFSNLIFDADDDFSSSDDELFSDEDVPKEIYSNPLFDEEIISTKIDPHHFNADSDLIESLLNQDTLIIFSPKIHSLLEEFSGELAHIDLIPPGINETNFDPEEDIRLLERLFNYSPSLPINESFHFDVLSSRRPLAKPRHDDEIKLDMGVLTAKVVGDISELYVHVPNVLTTLPTLSPMFDTLLPFSSENDDKVFNHGILASNEEKSPHFLSHRGFNPSKIISDFSESPMMIYGGNIPNLDVPFLHFYPP
ncbi:hypothetical protein Tco_0656404 [Tanacetum coccineum]|uniref:CCHC-type domain-containing protein n=1 Tax=Tanacetum coccineum TaxID=301880 RepID=A0ABQ4X8N6_9ASTR